MLWNEPKGPDFVLEVTSKSTRGEDERRKRELYASLGVRGVLPLRPAGGVAHAAASGLSAARGGVPNRSVGDGAVEPGVAVASEVLGLELRDERAQRRVRLRDPATGEVLLTHEESERAREEAERAHTEEVAARRAAEAQAAQEAEARRAADARAAELEARLQALEGAPEPPDAL